MYPLCTLVRQQERELIFRDGVSGMTVENRSMPSGDTTGTAQSECNK